MADAIVYVDGFNLYYGSLKRTPYKWLDLGRLCARMLPNDRVIAIKYYTARISARPGNPGAPNDQQDLVAWIIPKDVLSLCFSTPGIT